MVRFDSDWIRPVTVTLNNATVSSSEVIGTACHVAKIIDEQTVQLTLPLKCDPEFGGVCGLDTGSGALIRESVIDPGSSCLDTGSITFDTGSVVDIGSGGLDPGIISLDPGTTIVYSGILDIDTGIRGLDPVSDVDPGCNVADIESSVGDTETNVEDTICGLCDPGKDIYVSGIDVCETGGCVREPKYDVSDAGCKICDSKSNALRPRSRGPGSDAHEQGRDLGKYFTINMSNFHYC